MLADSSKYSDAFSSPDTSFGDDPASAEQFQFGTSALASNQRRVRGLQRVIAYNLPPLVAPSIGYEYTLSVPTGDSTIMVYTSEACLSSICTEWEPLVLPTSSTVSDQKHLRLLSSVWVVIRVYASREVQVVGGDRTPVVVWLVDLPGLVPVRPDWQFESASLLFCHRGQWLTARECVRREEVLTVPQHVLAPSDSLPAAAAGEQLERLHRCQHERHRLETVLERVRVRAEDNWQAIQPTRRLAATLHARKRHLHMLRQLSAQCRRRVGELRTRLSSGYQQLLDRRGQLGEAAASLSEARTALMAWRACSWPALAAVLAEQSRQLRARRRELLTAVGAMFELDTARGDVCLTGITSGRSDFCTVKDGPLSILGISLPDADRLSPSNSAEARAITVALAHVAHTVRMCSWIVGTCLRYPIEWRCGQVVLCDLVLSGLLNTERQFVLAPGPNSGTGLSGGSASGGEPGSFQYGVYLLSKDVAQLCAYCHLDCSNLPALLLNLSALVSDGGNCGVAIDREVALLSSSVSVTPSIDCLSTAFDSPPSFNRRAVLGWRDSPIKSSSTSTVHSSTDSSGRSLVEETPTVTPPTLAPEKITQTQVVESDLTVDPLAKSTETVLTEAADTTSTTSPRDSQNHLSCDPEWNLVTTRMETLVLPKSFKLLSKRT